MPKRILKGQVVSDKNQKTVVVNVTSKYKHPLYKKILNRSKRYQAHDEQGVYKMGDIVRIIESKPMSRTKRFEVIYEDKENSDKA